MASEGMPIPNIPVADTDCEGIFTKFLAALTSFFKPAQSHITTVMNKSYTLICALLGIEAIALAEGKASLSDEQLGKLEAALSEKDAKVSEQAALIADLQAKLAAKPAAQSSQIVDEGKPSDNAPRNDVEEFVDTYNSARQLFNEV